MNITLIITAIQNKNINITKHAREEAKNDNLLFNDIYYSTINGEIIKNYPDDKPYPSCLIFGKTKTGIPVHTVWAYDNTTKIAILITVYRPDENLWMNNKIRKK